MEQLLLVEHNRLFREGLAVLFEWRTGLSSVRAGSLAEARAILEEAERKPACVVVDLDLPGGRAQKCSRSWTGNRCWR
jgi:DNA-binding NarL/FixJ family response regulator